MADNAWNCGAFSKIFDGESNPFLKMLGGMNAPLGGPMKEMAAKSLESGEKWARQAVEMNEKATEWAKDTPLASVFETQRSFALRLIDSSATLVRQMWQLEAEAEKPAAGETPAA